MIPLDMKTIVFCQVIISIVCTLFVLALWRQSRKRFAGIDFLFFDFVFQTAALFLIILRGPVSPWIAIVLSNTLILSGAILGYMGLERFVEKKGPQLHNVGLLVLFTSVHTYFTFTHPSLAIRTLNLSIGLFLIGFQCLRLLLFQVEPDMRKSTFTVGLVFGGYCLISMIRIVDFFREHPQPPLFEPLILISYQMLFILLTYSLVLMTNKRLLREIQTEEEKFTKAFHSSPYALILTRLSDGRIMEVNEGFVKISGYGYDEIKGKTTIDLNLWHKEEDRSSAVQELAATGKVQDKEFQFQKKTGENLTGLFSAEIIRIGDQEFVLSSINDITERKLVETQRENLIKKLQEALANVNHLSGLLPICASCKRIRDDKGYWNQVETYIQNHTGAEFSHSLCPECEKKLNLEMEESKFFGERVDHGLGE